MRQLFSVLVLLLAIGTRLGIGLASGSRQATPPAPEPHVTPVDGPSWLARLGLPYSGTNLGRGTGTYGPAPSSPAARGPALPLTIGQPLRITGADLFRLNCRACHRAEGTGAPPEIKSVIAAVQGSNLEAVRKQLRARGQRDDAAARRQADAARADLFARIQKGGQRMPALAHLQQPDLDLLYGYLTELAAGRGAAPAASQTIGWYRLGEHTVKGTCHICHGAVGPRPTPAEMLRGAVPPFTSILASANVVELMKKVRSGAPVLMGDPPLHYRGRMPTFDYLRDEELAAAYMFLNAYPPRGSVGGRGE